MREETESVVEQKRAAKGWYCW